MKQARHLLYLIALLLLNQPVTAQMRPTGKMPVSRYDSTQTEEVFFQVSEIKRLKPDSAIATLAYGKEDGLFLGATGNIMTSHIAVVNAKGPARESATYIGNAEIISISGKSATASIKLYNRYLQEIIYPGDLLSMETYVLPGVKKNIFHELARLDIFFLDNAREAFYTKKEFLENNDPGFEQKQMQRYADEILDFREDIVKYADSSFYVPYTKGPFKGKSLIDIFRTASYYDLSSFFHFVKRYPGKYMGNSWKINETFATWVINHAPQGDKNREWLLPIIERQEFDKMPDLVKQAGPYIQYDTLVQWAERVNALQGEGKTEAALQLCDKLIYIARQLKDQPAEYEFYYNRSFLADATGDTKTAIADILKAHRYNPKHINYKYQLASLYGKTEQFDKCFPLYDELLKELPGNVNIMGNYGWYKLFAGQVDEAIPYCRAAYYGDSSNVAFTVNYAHTFLIKGNMDSARYLYQKTLDNLSSPADYTSGPKTDFDFLFKKGWNRKAVAEIADWMDKEFAEKYYFITRGNEVWNKAKKFYDAKNYRDAAATWKDYIALYEKSREPPLTWIHNVHNWLGSSYYKARMYDSSLYHYQVALKMATEKLSPLRNIYTTKENDYAVGDYERIYNFYSNTGNKLKAEQYKTLYNAEAQKVAELYAAPALHLIALGGKGQTGEYNGQPGSNVFYESLRKLKDAKGNRNYTKLADGTGLTRDKLVSFIDEVRKTSKPEDIFVFYYAGESISHNNQSFINFNTKDTAAGRIAITELMDHIDLVYANKKMVITDLPNAPLLNLITTKYASTGNNSAEIIFLSPGLETPMEDNGVSLFTNQLVKTVNGLQQKGSFTAKDFIDKASYAVGRGQHYLPVLSFTNSKDFIIYETAEKDSGSVLTTTLATRGLQPTGTADNNEDPTLNSPQKNYALLFATDLYQDNGFNKLVNPINDARALETLLKNDFGFEVQLVKNPTRDEVEKWLSDYRDNKSYGPNDQLLIFFAGHGVYYDKAKMGYLVTSDSKVNDPTHKTYLSYSDLGNIYLKNISCNRIFLVLDACFAGSFFDNNGVRSGPNDIDARNLSYLKKASSNQRFYKGISSGGKQYVEDGKPGQHSPFASSFLKTLFNKAMQKNFVTADEIIGEIKSNPPGSSAVCEGNFHYSDPLSHFIFELKHNQKASNIKSANLK